jgi:hypothetical protein
MRRQAHPHFVFAEPVTNTVPDLERVGAPHFTYTSSAIWSHFPMNADVYLVATKTITQLKPMSMIVSGGVQGTNAELLGLGGNASKWGPVGFGAVAFVFPGPARSAIVLGAEVAQQPRHPDQLPNAVIRTAFVYALRVIPSPRLKLNVDFGILEGPGQIAPGVDLKAKDCPGGAISFAF